ncbi:MAG TPA: efflux RND transporter permease subunit, partial [Roseiflexaceae bacterium]|nr:efflux RND transporter permease subunit [Roseiflexaceae bacterium]
MTTPTSEPKLNGNRIADTSIRQPVFVTMLMLVALVIGALAYTTLPVNLLPDIDLQVIAVTVPYPGAGPESVADQVAKPLEDELSTLSGVTTITSNSSEGLASIAIEFTQETDMAAALQDVREHVGLVRARLPREVDEPLFRRLDPAQRPILTLAISSKSAMNPAHVRRLIEDQIVPAIQSAPGVGSTTLTGGLVRQINVQLDLQQLMARRILPSQVSNAIAAANTNLGLGDVRIGNQGVNLRAPSVLAAPGDIAEIGIPGTPYFVRDVATIEDGYADVETYSRLNGSDAISLDIRKQSGTNTVAVVDAALTSLDRAFAQYPDLRYQILRNDAEQVRANVNGAIEEMLLAVLFALLVVLFFFRDLRNTLVTVAGLPVILIATFALMRLLGMTINIVSLLALSLSVGLVIDDAIVVRENIFRHMQRGATPRMAASQGTAEVSLSVLAMTLTIIAVFLPVAFTSGLTGNIFRAFGLTVAGAMAISLVEAFTLAPMLSAFFFSQQRAHTQQVAAGEQHLPDEAPEQLGRVERSYERLLGWTLRHRFVAVVIAAGVAVGSVVAARGVQFAFLPDPGRNEFGMRFELPPGALLEQTDRRARQAEQILLADPAVEAVLSRVGGPGTPETATFFIKLHA